MTTGLLVLLTVAWSLLAFGLFVGTDHLAARLLGREPTFEWFDRTAWSGRSTPGRRRATRLLSALAAVVGVAFMIALALALLALALSPLLPDRPSPRPPAEAPKR